MSLDKMQIRYIRQVFKQSQEVAANQLGIDVRTLRRYESGEQSLPSSLLCLWLCLNHKSLSNLLEYKTPIN